MFLFPKAPPCRRLALKRNQYFSPVAADTFGQGKQEEEEEYPGKINQVLPWSSVGEETITIARQVKILAFLTPG
ncbi:unnamed protein product [marine sediment metagenome]|uniref:Uncharacterized protein n=1 Tax=marine sediment metagenome TaxID=412755 RepID=X1S9X5_9ZZZZ